MSLVVPALTGAGGLVSGLFMAAYQSSRAERKERLAKQEAVQLSLLDPLRIATENLAWKFAQIDEKIRRREEGSGGLKWMLRMFHCAKEPGEILGRRPSEVEYGSWCNGEGFFAVSSLYATAVYFLHARRARRECTADVELMRRLDAVRLAMGHDHGIYVMLQDSIGDYVAGENGAEIGYREFCGRLMNDDDRPWFLNMLDYYREIDLKTVDQRQAIGAALRALLVHIEGATGVRAYAP